jgi:hypothetical protein
MFALVDQYTASGMTRKAFCSEQGINIHIFSNWVAKMPLGRPTVWRVCRV